jgi:catechol 2,3-dioxygenase-like lactoylglutathione lyase family enzyme
MERPRTRVAATVLGAPDPRALAAFYAQLLGWTVRDNQPEWVTMASPDGGTGLSFQHEPHWAPPVWPAVPGEQQMTMHLDIGVEDLEKAVAWAVDAGATLADYQPQEDNRVMLDPAGHPFCLFLAADPFL